jgi:hypothetical protein
MSELLLPASLASWPKHSEEWPASKFSEKNTDNLNSGPIYKLSHDLVSK